MTALLDERSKRYKEDNARNPSEANAGAIEPSIGAGSKERDLKSLVESVKRKSAAATAGQGGEMGKRRRLA